MASNSRLAIAIHTAGMLAFGEEMPITSTMIAKSVNTNPVVIRRIIGSLVKHGLVEVKMGTGGGSKLAKPASNISIAEIYLALEEGEIFHVPDLEESHGCPVAKLVRPVLKEIFGDAEDGLIAKLRHKTLQHVIDELRMELPADFCLKKLSNG
ncbi:MAG: Rrf2 family transcriptional regulator [Pyrinomonadaceae bacterium]|nr:Rrf2 family transcriptional regulator [Pyrinomonadaceae bacterium]